MVHPLSLAEKIYEIERPHPHLLWQYMLTSLFANVAFPAVALFYYFRYKTLRYRFDEKGISISYGILFRRQTFLTYARIQDIHVKRNLLERWLSIGTVEIETAAGGSGGESIVGLTEFEEVRDFLYSRMRGATQAQPAQITGGEQESTTVLLREIRDALRDVRVRAERKS
jgi:putative membrane protein